MQGAAVSSRLELPVATEIDGDAISKGMTFLKEAWLASNRLAELNQKHGGKAIPIVEIFGTLLGFGDKLDPLEEVKKKLDEINAKLDRVLEGIKQILNGLLGLGTLNVYLDISDSLFLIDMYFEMLPGYIAESSEAEREQFTRKMAGNLSERDGVPFCAQKIARQSPLLFDLLFEYVSKDAKKEDAMARFLKGAFGFRMVTDAMVKAMLLELFVVSSTGYPSNMSERAKKVTDKYGVLLRRIVDSHFLPFAERLAMYRFTEEYMGGNHLGYDAHQPLKGWNPPPAKDAILPSADAFVAKLMGRSKSVTLRVLPNVPPIAKRLYRSPTPGTQHAGYLYWEYVDGSVTPTPPTKDTLLRNIENCQERRGGFLLSVWQGRNNPHFAKWVSRCDIAVPDGAQVPAGSDKSPLSFVKSPLSFLRLEYDLGDESDGSSFRFYFFDARSEGPGFPDLRSKWRELTIEDGREERQKVEEFQQGLYYWSEEVRFYLPADGQLSPVLTTYMYECFGQRKTGGSEEDSAKP